MQRNFVPSPVQICTSVSLVQVIDDRYQTKHICHTYKCTDNVQMYLQLNVTRTNVLTIEFLLQLNCWRNDSFQHRKNFKLLDPGSKFFFCQSQLDRSVRRSFSVATGGELRHLPSVSANLQRFESCCPFCPDGHALRKGC